MKPSAAQPQPSCFVFHRGESRKRERRKTRRICSPGMADERPFRNFAPSCFRDPASQPGVCVLTHAEDAERTIVWLTAPRLGVSACKISSQNLLATRRFLTFVVRIFTAQLSRNQTGQNAHAEAQRRRENGLFPSVSFAPLRLCVRFF